MSKSKSVRRDFDLLEKRRLRAARLLEKGVPQAEVARRVGVHRQSVSRWAATLQSEGPKGLKKAGRAGRKPRLNAEDLVALEEGLKAGPQACGYPTALWTLPARGAPDRATNWHPIPSRPCLPHPGQAALELPAPGGPRVGAR